MSTTTAPTFTAEYRRQLLDRYFECQAGLESGALEPEAMVASGRMVQIARLRALNDYYTDGLPRLPLSRCPLCNAEQRLSFDPFGVDGLWWSNDEPARPAEEEGFCPHWLAQTGALYFGQPLPKSPLLVCPGPAAPYVIAPLLGSDEVCAVMSSWPVGPHRVFIIEYFEPKPNFNRPLCDVWPTNIRSPGVGRAPLAAAEILSDFGVQDFDFNLTPWITSQKLFWIAPDDPSCTLRKGLDECPYLKFAGSHEMQCLQGGEIWTSAT
ncbi:MAG: hypothetical protein FD134_650 [Gallionellaceae bacterium]|nr:MAG: hypothetical protein FD134_650 [Gallionellaceae bacterium]